MIGVQRLSENHQEKGMQHHLSQLEDIISVSRSAMCDLGFLFGRWVPNSSTVSNSNQFSFLSRIGKASSLRPNFTSVLEHSSREVQCGEGTIEMKPGQNADNPLLPKCVIMKKQPFYDHKKDIIRSWYLAPVFSVQKSFSFLITSDVAESVAGQDYKILLRFCCLDLSCEQDDKHPPKLQVQVNGKACNVKGGSFPVNITALCNIATGTSNTIQSQESDSDELLARCAQVCSSSGHGEYYVVSLSLVKKLTVNDLMRKLRRKNPSKMQDTKALIKRKLKQGKSRNGIATTAIQCSLVCPLTVTRMTVPCRGIYCQHFQCFDAVAYLQVNEQKSLWICPVCQCQALFPDLLIDRYFQEVLAQAENCNKVSLLKDGSWTPMFECDLQANTKEHQGTTEKRTFEEITVTDSDEESPHIEIEKEVMQIREEKRVCHQGKFPVDPLETSGRSSQTEGNRHRKRKRRPRSQ